MANASSATATCVPVPSYAFAMNATTDLTKADALFVGTRGYPMHTTARNAPCRRKTEMVAPRLSIWAPQRRICSMSARSTDSRNISPMMMTKMIKCKGKWNLEVNRKGSPVYSATGVSIHSFIHSSVWTRVVCGTQRGKIV
jgi:hypothetical protein